MDIFTHLVKDHEKAASLMNEIETTTNPATRLTLFMELKDVVLKHARAEEETFYARLEAYEEAREMIADARHDHELVERLFHEIEGLDDDVGTEVWMGLFTELKETIENHVDEEETEIFDLARDLLDEDEVVTLDRRMRQIETRPGLS